MNIEIKSNKSSAVPCRWCRLLLSALWAAVSGVTPYGRRELSSSANTEVSPWGVPPGCMAPHAQACARCPASSTGASAQCAPPPQQARSRQQHRVRACAEPKQVVQGGSRWGAAGPWRTCLTTHGWSGAARLSPVRGPHCVMPLRSCKCLPGFGEGAQLLRGPALKRGRAAAPQAHLPGAS